MRVVSGGGRIRGRTRMPVVSAHVGERAPSGPATPTSSRDSLGWVAAVVLLTLSAIVTLTFVSYVVFILSDTGDGFYSKNVTAAMEPAILVGDYITSRRITAGSTGDAVIHRGDVVVHAWPPDRSKQFVKRIVGLPGDTLAMTNGMLSVNGRTLAEPYAHRDEPEMDPVVDEFNWQRPYVAAKAAMDTSRYVASRNTWGPLVVPRGEYFVLGDNRDNSLDSRYWGFLPRADVQARVRRVYFSRDTTGRIRWSRFGQRVE